jgi:hypothetical protein
MFEYLFKIKMKQMSSPLSQFENDLDSLKFSIKDGEEICDHEVKDFICYVQDDSESYGIEWIITHNAYKHLPWRKSIGCEECMDSFIGMVDCGGHYSNFRMFHGDKEVSHNYGLGSSPLDPDEPFFDEDDYISDSDSNSDS